MKRVLAIINPHSGTGAKGSIPQELASVFEGCQEQLFVSFTKRAGHATELARMAVEEGYSKVIAVGGDGTVNEIASALLHSQTALSIIPKGSGNGLARALGIPMNTHKAMLIAAQGDTLRIDCCMANGQPFFCTCGMGFDAEVSAAFAEAPFRGLLSYAQTAIRKYLTYTPSQYRICFTSAGETQQKCIETEAFVVAAANASQYGNNAHIAPRAKVTDGVLDLVVLKPFSHLELAQVTLQLFTQKLEDNLHQSSYQTTCASIERTCAGVVHLDGEPIHMDARIDIEVIPSSINVVVPNLTVDL